ncbi:MAG: hypothetical protein J5623_09325 [Clostridiales bacterium]|nr:hypothetical protein [Clostridiales bacterium]
MSNERQYYEDIGYKPFLFYVVFGVSGDELEVSKTKHNVDGMPEGLEIISLARPEHSESIDGLIGGGIGELLRKADSALYDSCKAAEKVVIIRGEIANDSTLDYMRNLIGICEAFIDKGAKGILDLQTFTLYSPKEWTDRFFGKDVNAQNHVLIMFSKEDDGYWIHTRGMAEFGRPDYGISKVPEGKLEDYKQVIDQMVFYGGQGIIFKGKAKLHTFNGKAFEVVTEFVNDFENDDYNNAYYNVTVLRET